MGQYAEDIIDGFCDQSGDYMYKYNTKTNNKTNKLSFAENCIRKVRKELALLIQEKQKQGDSNPVNNARKEINLKYGKGWRERGLVSNSEDQWKPLNEY